MWKCLLAASCSCPSVSMCQFGSHQTDFIEIWYWRLWLKCQENSIWLKSDRTSRHFMKRSKHILFLWNVFQLNNTEQNMLLHVHGNVFNIYIADSNTGRSTIQRVHNAEFPWHSWNQQCCEGYVTLLTVKRNSKIHRNTSSHFKKSNGNANMIQCYFTHTLSCWSNSSAFAAHFH